MFLFFPLVLYGVFSLEGSYYRAFEVSFFPSVDFSSEVSICFGLLSSWRLRGLFGFESEAINSDPKPYQNRNGTD